MFFFGLDVCWVGGAEQIWLSMSIFTVLGPEEKDKVLMGKLQNPHGLKLLEINYVIPTGYKEKNGGLPLSWEELMGDFCLCFIL